MAVVGAQEVIAIKRRIERLAEKAECAIRKAVRAARPAGARPGDATTHALVLTATNLKMNIEKRSPSALAW